MLCGESRLHADGGHPGEWGGGEPGPPGAHTLCSPPGGEEEGPLLSAL